MPTMTRRFPRLWPLPSGAMPVLVLKSTSANAKLGLRMTRLSTLDLLFSTGLRVSPLVARRPTSCVSLRKLLLASG